MSNEIIFLLCLLVVYLTPLVWCLVIGFKPLRDTTPFFIVFGIIPVINICIVISHYESLEEDRKYEERYRLGMERVANTKEKCKVVIDFLDGSKLESRSFGATFDMNHYIGFTSPKGNAESWARLVVKQGYAVFGDVRHPYHTMKELTVVEVKDV